MGTRNPRLSSFSEFARGVDSVHDMRVRRWRVRAYCPTCQKAFKVNLGLIAAIKGPRYSLWDRQSPCKLYGCAGKVHFEALPHRSQHIWTELSSPQRLGLAFPAERLNGRPVAPQDYAPASHRIDGKAREALREDDDPCGWL